MALNNGTVEMFEKWWKRDNERPMLWIVSKDNNEEVIDGNESFDYSKKYLDPIYSHNKFINRLKNRTYHCEAFESLSMDLGPGSLALYLGTEPVFQPDTIWYKEWIEELDESIHFKFNEDNEWYKKHISMLKELKTLSDGRYIVNIPDIIENIDIYAAMRGPQDTCFDMMDEPSLVSRFIKEIDDTYMPYYNRFYNELNIDGVSSFTAFRVLGKGRVAKVQCDFSAMMSPSQYREFVMPTMQEQLASLDHSIYHLDGKDAIVHLDAIMEYKDLDALQWTPGAGYRDGTSEEWYQIYDRVKEHNKCLWVMVYDGDVNDWIRNSKRMINRYGKEGVYFLYNKEMSLEDANRIMDAMNV